MTTKKINLMLLASNVIYAVFSVIIYIFFPFASLGIISSLLLGQLIIFIPAVVTLVLGKHNLKEIFPFHKIRISTVLLIIVFTYLMIPLTTFLNSLSMLFTDNTISLISGSVLKLPFLLVVFLMGILGPMNEELTYRGMVYSTYKGTGKLFGAAILSALMFGMMHMNYNQAIYAFVLGILLVLIREATGNMWAPIIMHMVFNINSVVLLFLVNGSGVSSEMANVSFTNETLIPVICVYAVIALLTTVAGICLLFFIAKREGREQDIKNQFKIVKNKDSKRIFTIPLVLTIIVCLGYMTWDLFM